MKYFVSLILCLLSRHAIAAKTLTSVDGTDVVNGKAIHFEASSASMGTVLVFLSAKCPCSASHESLLKELSENHKNFNFIGIHANSDEDMNMTKSHFSDSHLPFPVIQDNKSKLANELSALKTPHAFVLNKKGEVIYQGGVTDSHVGPAAKKQFLKEALEDVEAGKEPRIKEGRALGCFIQREDD